MRKYAKIIAICLFVISIVALATACGNKADNGGEKKQEVITLIGADMTPGSSSTAQMMEWWSKEVESKTNGQLKFEYFWGGSLIGQNEQLEAVKTGSIQFSAYYSGFHPDIAPLPSLALMPMMNIIPLAQAMPAVDELYRTHPAIQAEFESNNVKYLYPVYVPDAYLWSPKIQINTVDDLKGLVVRGFGPWMAFFDALGAAPVSIPVPEIYDALDRGALDVDMMFLPNATGNSYWEVCKYVNTTNLGANLGAPAVINLDVWNSLSPEIQAIIEQAGKDAVARSIELDKEFYARDIKSLEDHGTIMNQFSQQDIDYMREVAKVSVWEPLIEELEGRGIAARDVYNTYLALLEKYS